MGSQDVINENRSWRPNSANDHMNPGENGNGEHGSSKEEQQNKYFSQYSANSDPFQHKYDEPKPACAIMMVGSRQLGELYSRETSVRMTLIEVLLYAIYLTSLGIVVYRTHSTTAFYFSKLITDLFVDREFESMPYRSFRKTVFADDFWHFTEGPMLESLYWSEKFNTKSLQDSKLDNATLKSIMFDNKLLGAPRLRQVRVRSNSCSAIATFKANVKKCYGFYHTSKEETGPIKPVNGLQPLPPEAWDYATAEKLGQGNYNGDFSTYGGGGYYTLLFMYDKEVPGKSPKDATEKLIQELKKRQWITRATRALFLDFSVFNANIKMLCVVKLVWELPPTGGAFTNFRISIIQIGKYDDIIDKAVTLPSEIIFCVFTLYYLVQEIVEFAKMKCVRYFKCVWSWLDLVILVLSSLAIGFEVTRYVLLDSKELKLLEKATAQVYVNHEVFAYWSDFARDVKALLIFFALIKVFKFLSFNKTMSQLSATLSRCAGDIMGFALMFFVVFVAFAQLGCLIFGSQVKDFSTFLESIFTLLQLTLGEFDFRAIQEANSVLGPLFYISYVFFVFFVLLNMFLAIINDTFGEVKAEIQARGDRFEIADFFARGFNNLKRLWGKKDPKRDARYAAKLAAADGRITTREIKEHLQRAGFSDVEIEMFLSRYQLDESRNLDEDEIEHLLRQLEGHQTALFGDIGINMPQGVPRPENSPNAIYDEELEALNQRVQTIESSLSKILSKLDNMVHQMKTVME